MKTLYKTNDLRIPLRSNGPFSKEIRNGRRFLNAYYAGLVDVRNIILTPCGACLQPNPKSFERLEEQKARTHVDDLRIPLRSNGGFM